MSLASLLLRVGWRSLVGHRRGSLRSFALTLAS